MSERDYGRRIPFCGDDVDHADWLAARSIAREYLPPERGDAARWEHDASRIERALRLPSYRNHTIEMDCFNAEDVRQIEARIAPRLSHEDRLRVRLVCR